MSFKTTNADSRAVAQRIKLEGRVARKIVRALLAAGYSITVFDGEEETVIRCRQFASIINAMNTTDQDYLLVYKAGSEKRHGWVRFIYGNDGWDVVNDYTTNLESLMAPINDWSESFDPRR